MLPRFFAARLPSGLRASTAGRFDLLPISDIAVSPRALRFGAWCAERPSERRTIMSYRNLATSLLTCGDLLAGLEKNRSELPFLADAADQMTADVAEMRMLESKKQLLQAELAEATHRRQALEAKCIAEHRRIVHSLQGFYTLYSDRLREFGLRPRTRSARRFAAPLPEQPQPTPVTRVAAESQP